MKNQPIKSNAKGKTRREMSEIYEQYIMDSVKSADEILEEYGEEANTEAERIKFVLDCFNREVNNSYNKKRIPNLQARLADWFMGLPSVISIDFENYKILELCKKWGVLPQEAKEKQEDKILSGWYSYIAMQLLKAAKKREVDYSFIY